MARSGQVGSDLVSFSRKSFTYMTEKKFYTWNVNSKWFSFSYAPMQRFLQEIFPCYHIREIVSQSQPALFFVLGTNLEWKNVVEMTIFRWIVRQPYSPWTSYNSTAKKIWSCWFHTKPSCVFKTKQSQLKETLEYKQNPNQLASLILLYDKDLVT